jgi:kynurenine 3-monooxygenase
MYNYNEVPCSPSTIRFQLRDLVNHTSYKLRKKLDLFLNRFFPNAWHPLYGMVTFTRIPYHEAIERRHKQDTVTRVNLVDQQMLEIVRRTITTTGVLLGVVAAGIVYRERAALHDLLSHLLSLLPLHNHA